MNRLDTVTAMVHIIAADLIIGLLGIPVAFAFSALGEGLVGPERIVYLPRAWQSNAVLISCFGVLSISFILYSLLFIRKVRVRPKASLLRLILLPTGLLPVTVSISLVAVYARSCFDQALSYMMVNMALVTLATVCSPWRAKREGSVNILLLVGYVLTALLRFSYGLR